MAWEASAFQPVCCPAASANCQPKEEFALQRRRRFPDGLVTSENHRTEEESPICRSGGVLSRHLPSPKKIVLLRHQDDCSKQVPEVKKLPNALHTEVTFDVIDPFVIS